MTSKAKPNVRGKEAKMPLDSKKRPTFQAGLSFEHYVRSSQRKQWNSLIPLCKELVDNSRDAEAENVYFDFYNYKGQTRVSDSGGIISYLDDGRGLALKDLGVFDWNPVLNFYGNQQTLTDENTKAGLNGIGLKDAVLSMGNEVLFFTKSKKEDTIGYIFINFKGVKKIESVKVKQKQIEEMSSDPDVPIYVKKYVKDKLEQQMESKNSFFGFVVSDTKTDIAAGSKEQNNYWKNNQDPKTISSLKDFLLHGENLLDLKLFLDLDYSSNNYFAL